MSAEGPKRWIQAIQRSRARSQTIDAFFPEIDESKLVTSILDRLGTLRGQSGCYFGGCINALSDVPWDEKGLHQALLFLRENGLAHCSSRLGRDANPAPRFTFAKDWPQALAWDGLQRAEAAIPQMAPARSGH
jgi:hypothetical protein